MTFNALPLSRIFVSLLTDFLPKERGSWLELIAILLGVKAGFPKTVTTYENTNFWAIFVRF
jgi:hypothetical protein